MYEDQIHISYYKPHYHRDQTALPSCDCHSNKWDNICKLSLRQWHCQGESQPRVVIIHREGLQSTHQLKGVRTAFWGNLPKVIQLISGRVSLSPLRVKALVFNSCSFRQTPWDPLPCSPSWIGPWSSVLAGTPINEGPFVVSTHCVID